MEKEGTVLERTLAQAWALSQVLGHSFVGTEHLLLALRMEAQGALRLRFTRLGLEERELMGQLLAWKGRGCSLYKLPQGLSPRAKQAIFRAARASRPLTEETLLRWLLQDRRCGAVGLLERCAVSVPLLYPEKDAHLHTTGGTTMTRLLEQFAVDLVERADKSDPVIGRGQEIETVLRILCRRQKNNPALIGEPGVGKTAIVEGVAGYIAAGRVPEALRGKRIFALDMAAIIAGTKYRGEFEERVRDIVAEVKRAQNVILFIDEMHTLVGAGAAEGAIDAANLLKPALGRGELQLIGATTLEEYRKHIEKDAALERRFRTVLVRQPDKEETREILEGLRGSLEAHHHISISTSAIHAAVDYSCRYLPEKFLPDKAVDLLDEGAACANMRRFYGPSGEEAHGLEAQLRRCVEQGEYEQAARLRDRLQQLKQPAGGKAQVLPQDIAAAVSNRTGIPVGRIGAQERSQLCRLEALLEQRVIGQEEAIRAVAQAVRRGRSGLAEEQRPVAAMLFTGPTGVGKTELCKALAQTVYGSEEAMIRIDMSEYMEKYSASRLIGAPPGYVGHEQGGELSEKVRRRPYSLVLLDELEKAHRDVCGLLLQIMEDGILTDSWGRKVDFKHCLLVMTSNLEGAEGAQGAVGFGAPPQNGESKALREHFPPEFLGRLDCVACFRPLGARELTRIAALQLKALCQRGEKRGLQLQLPEELAAHLAQQALGKKGGARELRRLIRRQLEAPLSLRLLSDGGCTAASVTLVHGEVCVSGS